MLFASLFNMTEAELQTFLAPQQDGQSNLPLQQDAQSNLYPQEEVQHLIGKQTGQRNIAKFKKKNT
jgi:hypothetical protein